ncbi:putative phosphoribosyltransferase [Desulfuromonas soudanensis]|uniref:Putative phosphoribosyltransferase n=1 Tax=Desulfuromonas soudanensis TaxID=1603606 RepID=A0A0M3QG38_9BACT|nr:phosphoribosyltransferase family protein [Desulfuromonas soudanensis]ALC17133.1 putative phosphoribosyltransferase [Desulfuromonas soudanensis]
MAEKKGNIHEVTTLHGRIAVFADRRHGGEVLAGVVPPNCRDGVVLGIPAGGVPVAARLAELLRLPLDVAAVSKIVLPWNSEAGYGAVAYDGTVLLNEKLLPTLGLDEAEIRKGIERTTEKVRQRIGRFRGDRPWPDVTTGTVILVDDGLASGFTMQAAVAALRREGAKRIVVAVPTGHDRAVARLAGEVEALCCANIRSGWSFAVAAAYRQWHDVSDEEVEALLRRQPVEKNP